MTCTAWVVTAIVKGKKYRSCQKHEPLSLQNLLSSAHCLKGVTFLTSLKSNLCVPLMTQNTTQNKCINSHAKTMTALQLHALLTGIHQLLVTSKTGLVSSSASNCQVQLQAPQSVSVTNSLTHSLIPTQIWRKQFLPKH